MSKLILLKRSLIFLILTVFTQVGGVVYLLTIPFRAWSERKLLSRRAGGAARTAGPLSPSSAGLPGSAGSSVSAAASRSSVFLGPAVRALVFIVTYLAVTLLIVPLLARPFGRVPMPITRQHHLQPNNIITCLLNRNYVRPQLRAIAMETAGTMNRDFPGTEINYLEASFPFINGFPLWPHLSHNDGKKLDLSFCYLDSKTGTPTNNTPSFFGYGICEEPRPGEKDQPCFCSERGYWQYNLLRKITPQGPKNDFIFDSVRTRALVVDLVSNPAIGKLFIEPHLKTRLHLRYDKIRYHGCRAVRHDDHVHVQLW